MHIRHSENVYGHSKSWLKCLTFFGVFVRVVYLLFKLWRSSMLILMLDALGVTMEWRLIPMCCSRVIL